MKADAREARQILRQCDFGALATHSVKLPGYPFVSHAPLALDGAGRPLLLLSRLAEHTRNLATDARASLMVSLPGPEPQAQPRLTLVGELRPPAEEDAAARARYLRYHPDAATYLGFGDFRFYRLEVAAVRLVAGFARAGWLAPADWAATLLTGNEAALLARLHGRVPPGWALLGLDSEGLDLRAPVRGRMRLNWPEGQDTPQGDEALEAVAQTLLSAVSGHPG